MSYQKVNNKGMTLPEFILAILMLTSFMAVTVMVTEFTARFFQPLNEEAKEEYISSNNVQAFQYFIFVNSLIIRSLYSFPPP